MAERKFIDVVEQKRLNDAREAGIPWKKWGPYLSERQWGTVREDYSEDGNAWAHFSHDQARSRAYRWGEDGLGGICDDKQRLCFAIALWNERDAILKRHGFLKAAASSATQQPERYGTKEIRWVRTIDVAAATRTSRARRPTAPAAASGGTRARARAARPGSRRNSPRSTGCAG